MSRPCANLVGLHASSQGEQSHRRVYALQVLYFYKKRWRIMPWASTVPGACAVSPFRRGGGPLNAQRLDAQVAQRVGGFQTRKGQGRGGNRQGAVNAPGGSGFETRAPGRTRVPAHLKCLWFCTSKSTHSLS